MKILSLILSLFVLFAVLPSETTACAKAGERVSLRKKSNFRENILIIWDIYFRFSAIFGTSIVAMEPDAICTGEDALNRDIRHTKQIKDIE